MKKLKYLIVEDNPYDVELVHLELTRSGVEYESRIVQTRVEFESAVKEFLPDVILSDYSLPSFDGETAFLIKQAIRPDIPFILVSGIVGEEKAVELIKSGVTDYVLKDKLYTLNMKITRALKEAEDKLERERFVEQLKLQNKELYEIAFLLSHEVRRPIANIIGLINLLNVDFPNDAVNFEVIPMLSQAAKELDADIHLIVQKTNELNAMSFEKLEGASSDSN